MESERILRGLAGREAKDIYDVLHEEHEAVANLFERLETADSDEQREALFLEIKAKLEVHSRAEERVFYDALRREEELRDLVSEATDEHEEISDLLDDITGMSPADDDWMSTVEQLKEVVEHHVSEEEGEIFTKAHQYLSDAQAIGLGRRMLTEERRQKAAA